MSNIPDRDQAEAGYLYRIFLDFMVRSEFNANAVAILDEMFIKIEGEAHDLVDDHPADEIERQSLVIIQAIRFYFHLILKEREVREKDMQEARKDHEIEKKTKEENVGGGFTDYGDGIPESS